MGMIPNGAYVTTEGYYRDLCLSDRIKEGLASSQECQGYIWNRKILNEHCSRCPYHINWETNYDVF